MKTTPHFLAALLAFALAAGSGARADDPLIGVIPNTTTNEDTATPPIPFTVGAVGNLTASSSNQALVRNADITLAGGGANRTIKMVPYPDANGSVVITVLDTNSNQTRSFLLTVRAVNDAPTFFSGFSSLSFPATAGPQSIPYASGFSRGGGSDENGQTLSFTATNTNNGMFSAQPAVDLNGTLTFTPSGIPGTATVTVVLHDGGGTANGGVDTHAEILTITTSTFASNGVVTSAADAGPGTLRQVLHDVVYNPIPQTVTFDPAVFTATSHTITLFSRIQIDVTNASGVIVDASNVPGGITISSSRPGMQSFYVETGATANLRGLTLLGFSVRGRFASNGGVIENNGTLGLTRCTISGGAVNGYGGAIYNSSTGLLALMECTVSGNNAEYVGAIHNAAVTPVVLTRCTLFGNSSFGLGVIGGPMTLNHCTVYGSGGGVLQGSGTVRNSIVIGNPIPNPFNPTVIGVQVVGNNLIDGNPLFLAPLGDYGGPTKTMALLPGNPARNAATGSTITSDQRGFPIVGTPDLGAYEAGTLSNYNAFAWESLPASATAAQRAYDFDFDGDGAGNGLEYALRRSPGEPGGAPFSPPVRTTLQPSNVPAVTITFPYRPEATDLRYTLQRNSDPGSAADWSSTFTFDLKTNLTVPTSGVTATFDVPGASVTITDTNVGAPQEFWRLRVQQVP